MAASDATAAEPASAEPVLEPLGWFRGYGVEIEYMIVDRETLDVRPIADVVLAELAGEPATQVERGPVAWSNELARHVIEIKTNGPVAELSSVGADVSRGITELSELLARHGARLMPSGMHPWMDPDTEFRLWPVDEEGIYETFDRLFDCRGHGWSNLQSVHLNLPFSNDEQLFALHSTIRFLLPLLPALAASSPFVEGRRADNLDQRLETYRTNAHRIPSVSGLVIPESVHSRDAYEHTILQRIYADLAPHDPEGTLRYEWVNARGCIARFDRMALEIRVLDAQESPRADASTAFAVAEVLRAFATQHHFETVDADWPPERLARLLWRVVRAGDQAIIDDLEYLALWGITSTEPLTAASVWRELIRNIPLARRSPQLWNDLDFTLEYGCLARRLTQATGDSPSRARLREVYGELCRCLENDDRFRP